MTTTKAAWSALAIGDPAPARLEPVTYQRACDWCHEQPTALVVEPGRARLSPACDAHGHGDDVRPGAVRRPILGVCVEQLTRRDPYAPGAWCHDRWAPTACLVPPVPTTPRPAPVHGVDWLCGELGRCAVCYALPARAARRRALEVAP